MGKHKSKKKSKKTKRHSHSEKPSLVQQTTTISITDTAIEEEITKNLKINKHSSSKHRSLKSSVEISSEIVKDDHEKLDKHSSSKHRSPKSSVEISSENAKDEHSSSKHRRSSVLQSPKSSRDKSDSHEENLISKSHSRNSSSLRDENLPSFKSLKESSSQYDTEHENDKVPTRIKKKKSSRSNSLSEQDNEKDIEQVPVRIKKKKSSKSSRTNSLTEHYIDRKKSSELYPEQQSPTKLSNVTKSTSVDILNVNPNTFGDKPRSPDTHVKVTSDKDKSSEVNSRIVEDKYKSSDVNSRVVEDKDKSSEVNSRIVEDKYKSSDVNSKVTRDKDKFTDNIPVQPVKSSSLDDENFIPNKFTSKLFPPNFSSNNNSSISSPISSPINSSIHSSSLDNEDGSSSSLLSRLYSSEMIDGMKTHIPIRTALGYRPPVQILPTTKVVAYIPDDYHSPSQEKLTIPSLSNEKYSQSDQKREIFTKNLSRYNTDSDSDSDSEKSSSFNPPFSIPGTSSEVVNSSRVVDKYDDSNINNEKDCHISSKILNPDKSKKKDNTLSTSGTSAEVVYSVKNKQRNISDLVINKHQSVPGTSAEVVNFTFNKGIPGTSSEVINTSKGRNKTDSSSQSEIISGSQSKSQSNSRSRRGNRERSDDTSQSDSQSQRESKSSGSKSRSKHRKTRKRRAGSSDNINKQRSPSKEKEIDTSFYTGQPSSMFDKISSESGKIDRNEVLKVVNQYKVARENSSVKRKITYVNVNINGKQLIFAKKIQGSEYPEVEIKYLGSNSSEPTEYEIKVAENYLMCSTA